MPHLPPGDDAESRRRALGRDHALERVRRLTRWSVAGATAGLAVLVGLVAHDTTVHHAAGAVTPAGTATTSPPSSNGGASSSGGSGDVGGSSDNTPASSNQGGGGLSSPPSVPQPTPQAPRASTGLS